MFTQKTINNFTGIAIPKTDKKGNVTLHACSGYGSVGMYSPCLKMENGYAVSLGLGGFTEDIAFGTPLPERKKQSVIIDSIKQ